MKIRSGFVSNSSSSSFIVAFEKVPESTEELRQMMFGDKELVAVYDIPAKTADLAAIVFADIQKQLGDLPHSKEALEDDFSPAASWEVYQRREAQRPQVQGGYYRKSIVNMTVEEKAVREKEWEDDNKARKQLQKKMVANMLADEEFQGKTILRFDYEDKGATTVLSIGGVFENLPHRTISNH